MQWFAQDSAASIASTDETPFDFSADPDSDDADASTIPPLSNYFWYYMMGNVGFVGYSGAHTYEETLPYIQDACTWASGQNMDALILLGHWNSASFGCDADMTVSAVFESMRAEPACAGVADRMKYFVGHSHCNIVLEENTGFMVGGQGMSDTHCGGDFGIPVLDTTGGRLKVYFFPIQQHRGYTYYQDTLQCIKNNGISGCYNMATLWADVPLSYITAGTSLQQLAK
ncbi:desi1 [Symbiodinium microadriaticum]|nr:desi1 [Symbiodinium microadriaticum]